MTLTFRVIEVTDRIVPEGFARAATYQIVYGDETLDDGQWRWAAPTPDKLPDFKVGDEFELAPKRGYGYAPDAFVPHVEVGQLWW